MRASVALSKALHMRIIAEHRIERHERSDGARVPLKIQSVDAPDLAKRGLPAEELS